jgi:vancomycin resistance protein YoaR
MNTEEVIKPKNKKTKWLLISVSIFLLLILGFVGTAAVLAMQYENKVYPGIVINDLNIGGLTKTQATNIISGKFKQTFEDGFTFSFENTTKTIKQEDNNTILNLNLESLIETAFQEGHNDNWFDKHWKIVAFPIFKKQIDLDYTFDKDLLKQELSTQFAIIEKPATNSSIELTIKNIETKDYSVDFSSSKIGETFNFTEAINNLEQQIKGLDNPTISLLRSTDYPTITKEQAETQLDKIEGLLQLDGVTFVYENKTWPVKWEDYARWLKLTLSDEESITIGLNEEMAAGHLEAIAQEIDQPATDAKLQIKDGRVTEFQASQNGLALNLEKNLELTKTQIINEANNQIDLIVEISEPEISLGNTNELGISEMIGSGWSDFSGSPSNRRHNISVGANSLHGIIIAPGEEFSLIKTLGDIDAQNGYKPELVIKNNETIPEYGGGLCQVGTTIFRTALQSGLEITARRNHSYRVGYYEPAGTDATIYDPWPDFKFLNDTENHILIQTQLQGNDLEFQIWGTSDGRKVSFEGNNTVSNLKNLKPTIFNITSPGPAKIIETTELEPGEKKRTEYAHNGADAVFYRHITKSDGEEIKETYSSHYVPWQEVFLLGIDPDEKEKEAQEQLAEENQETETVTDDETIPEEKSTDESEPITTTE